MSLTVGLGLMLTWKTTTWFCSNVGVPIPGLVADDKFSQHLRAQVTKKRVETMTGQASETTTTKKTGVLLR